MRAATAVSRAGRTGGHVWQRSDITSAQAQDFESKLLEAFKKSSIMQAEATDDGEAAPAEEDDDRDLNLEAAAAAGFDIGSQTPLGKRYALFRRSCAEETERYNLLDPHGKKKRVREWVKEQFDEYQDTFTTMMTTTAAAAMTT
eukprot:9479542-Pyramimonas_sp.AAC.1